MMRAPSREFDYWRTDKSWYRFNKETRDYELTDKAPKEAIESFKRLKEKQKRFL